MNPTWILRTARLVLTPVGVYDLADLRALKADPRVFAVMLGGVRTPGQAAELAEDVVASGANGFGIWSVRNVSGCFVGFTGLERRPDGRCVALRFALWPRHRAGWRARRPAPRCVSVTSVPETQRIVAVARANNFASRMVLGGIGMTECASFMQQGWRML
jgi:RimJ/RimL family protein N-acetyltransferase